MTMKKVVIFTISLTWLLSIQLSFIALVRGGVINPQGDLWGENEGDQIVFNWVYQDGTTKYIIYRSLSVNGPWEVLDEIDDVAARTSGSKEDVTPDARLKDLCYKVEAVDAKGNVTRRSEPICVPKFVP
jgi:hypothetical protein